MTDVDLHLVVAADANRRINAKRINKRRPGTVVGADPDTGTAQILIDGDDIPTDVSSVAGTPVVNDRVVVEFAPPHGVMLVGYVGGGASTGGTTGATGPTGPAGDDGEDGAPGRLTTAGRLIIGGHSYAGTDLNTPFGGTNPQNGDETRDSQNFATLLRDAVVGNALATRFLTAKLPSCVAGDVFAPGTTAVTTIPIPEDTVVEAVYLIPDLDMPGQDTDTRLHQVATRTFSGDIVFGAKQYNAGTDLIGGEPEAIYNGMGGVASLTTRARTTPTSLYAFPPWQPSIVYPAGESGPLANSLVITSVPIGNGLADPGGTILVRLGGRYRNTAQGGALLLMGGVYMGGWGAQFSAHRAPQAFGVEVNVTTTASSSATSIAVENLAAPVPSGWEIEFSNGVTATTTVAATTGATSLTVSALSGAVAAGNQGFAKPSSSGRDSYLPEGTFVGIWGVNDAPFWPAFHPGTTWADIRSAWRETTRAVIAMWSCPYLAPASRRNIVYTGTGVSDFHQPAAGQWVTNSPYGLATQPNKRMSEVGDTFTWKVAPDFPGGTLDLFFIADAGPDRGVQMAISVDGGTAKVLDTSGVSEVANYDEITGVTLDGVEFLTGTGYNSSMVGRYIDHPGVPAGAIVGAVNDAGTAITIWDPVTNTALDADADVPTPAAGHIIGFCPMVKRLTGAVLGTHTVTGTILSKDSADASVIFYGPGIETPTPVLWSNTAHLPNGFADDAITDQNVDTVAVLAGTAAPIGASTQEPALSTLVELIDIDNLLLGDPANFVSDDVHPNGQGHKLIADELTRHVGGITGDGSEVTASQLAALDARLSAIESVPIQRIYEQTIGDGSASLFGISHNLGRYHPSNVRLWDIDLDVNVRGFDYLPIDDNNGAIVFDAYVPTLNQFRVQITG